jgi:hypothetical protein
MNVSMKLATILLRSSWNASSSATREVAGTTLPWCVRPGSWTAETTEPNMPVRQFDDAAGPDRPIWAKNGYRGQNAGSSPFAGAVSREFLWQFQTSQLKLIVSGALQKFRGHGVGLVLRPRGTPVLNRDNIGTG